MLHKKLYVGLAPILAVAAFMVVPAMASAAEWEVGGVKVGGSPGEQVTTHSTDLTLTANNGVVIHCEVNDEGSIWNEGGVGKDEITKFEDTKCTSNITNCEAEPVLKVAVGTPMATELFVDAEGKIRDRISGVKVTVSCGGSPVAALEGELTPVISETNGTATFGAGSGELKGESGLTATVAGEDTVTAAGGTVTVK